MGSSAETDSAGPADPLQDTRLLRLAEEQAALRRIATLVASGAPPAEVFAAVAREVADVMRLPMVAVFRYDSDSMATVVANSDRPRVLKPGTRWPLDGPSMIAQVHKTGRPAGSRTTRTFPARSPPERVSPGSAPPRAPRSSSTARFGAPWGPPRQMRDSLTRSRIGSRGSPSSWRPRSPTPRAVNSSPGSPTSRARCGASRRSWRSARRRLQCSKRWSRRSAGSAQPMPLGSAAMRPTGRSR